MDKSEVLQRLSELPLMRDMPEDTQKRFGELLLRVSETVELAGGDELMRQGVLGAGAGFILIQGDVSVEREGVPAIPLGAPALLGEMQQFNPQALRTATVRATGEATALKFAWPALYTRAKEDLRPDERTMLMDGIERIVWERFDREALMDISLFRTLPDQLKLRVSVILQWLTQRLVLTDGQTLFKEEDMCGATGYLIAQGMIELTRRNQGSVEVPAPNILGVVVEFDPNRQWTATAVAKGDVELLKFTWLQYKAMLEERLSPPELQQFNEAVQASAKEHFEH